MGPTLFWMILLVVQWWDSWIWCDIIAKASCDWTFPVVVVLSIPTGWVSCTIYTSSNIRFSVLNSSAASNSVPPGSVLSVHFKGMDVHLFSFALFLRSVDKLLTIIQCNHYFHFGENSAFSFVLFKIVSFNACQSLLSSWRLAYYAGM